MTFSVAHGIPRSFCLSSSRARRIVVASSFIARYNSAQTDIDQFAKSRNDIAERNKMHRFLRALKSMDRAR